jgi:hypothetical protein
VEGEVMAELTEPRKQLALDTDRGSAVAMVVLFVFCALFAARELFEIVRGTRPVIVIAWHTWLLLGLGILYCFGTRDRWFRAFCLILALSSASRIMLHVFDATVETQLANAALLRVIDLMLFVGGCVYIPWWFKSKVRYV